jgi:hypothetical protein
MTPTLNLTMVDTVSPMSSSSPNTPPKVPCVSGIYKQTVTKEGNLIKVCDENAPKPLVPFSRTNIKSFSDLPKDDKSSGDVSVESSLSSNSSGSVRSRGGKNTKNKKTKKNKRKGKKRKTNRKVSRTSKKQKSKRKIKKKKVRRFTRRVGKK